MKPKATNDKLLSRLQLCQLAATLHKGGEVHRNNARGLIAQADILWEASGKFIEHKSRLADEQARREQKDREFDSRIPTPKSDRVFLPEILRLLVASKRTETDRTEVWRDFSKWGLPRDKAAPGTLRLTPDLPEATLDEVNAELERLRSTGVSREQFAILAGNFIWWRDRKTAVVLSERGTKAATARHKKPEKPL